MKYLFVPFLLIIPLLSSGQSVFCEKSDSLNTSRRNHLILGETLAAGISIVALDRLWYADYPRSRFHFMNDNNQWLQMDKVGHVMTSYYLGRMGMELLDWAGVSKKN